MKLVNWNVEWATPGGRRSPEILDRIHRISQTNECVVENLVAVGTIDEWVVELLSAKELAAALVQGDITRDEYREQATYAFNQVLQEVLNPPEE